MYDFQDIEICTDCLMFAANGWDGTDEPLPDEVRDMPGIPEGWDVIPGHHHNLEDCGADVMEGTADCPYDEGSSRGVPAMLAYVPIWVATGTLPL